MQNTPQNCPCGSGKSYPDCCQLLHLHWDAEQAKALTAEYTSAQLMRSRYCAFVLKNFDYIIKTHHPNFIGDLTLAELTKGPHPEWLALDILAAKDGLSSERPRQGSVTFKAWYRMGGQIQAIYECSEFIFESGRWYYTQGQQFQAKLPGRNDPCLCHSGKKFKQCCLNTNK